MPEIAEAAGVLDGGERSRPKYLEAFVDSLINWDYVLEMYEKAKAKV